MRERWKEGRKEGRREGGRERRKGARKEGRKRASKEGGKEGRNEGKKERRNEGAKEWRSEGRKEGRQEGRRRSQCRWIWWPKSISNLYLLSLSANLTCLLSRYSNTICFSCLQAPSPFKSFLFPQIAGSYSGSYFSKIGLLIPKISAAAT